MKKNLGQHFLKSKKALSTIVRAAHLSAKDTVLEIGPGKGVLTAELLKNAGKVIAIEKDIALTEYLKERFAEEIASGKLELIHDDIRNFEPTTYNLPTSNYKLVANIPYYITGQILRQFLTVKHKPECMVLLVQKEIAERIIARDGKESLLSISVRAFGTPTYVEKVPARYFSPPPDVDSAILSIANISSPFASPRAEQHFFNIARKGFAHKRKLLKSNIGCSAAVLKQCNIKESARAEEISIDQWICLAAHIS